MPVSKYTRYCSGNRRRRRSSASSPFLFSGNVFYLKNPSTNQYHKLSLTGVGATLVIGPALNELVPTTRSITGTNYQFNTAGFCLKNTTTNNYHRITLTGAVAVAQLAWAAGIASSPAASAALTGSNYDFTDTCKLLNTTTAGLMSVGVTGADAHMRVRAV